MRLAKVFNDLLELQAARVQAVAIEDTHVEVRAGLGPSFIAVPSAGLRPAAGTTSMSRGGGTWRSGSGRSFCWPRSPG